MVIRTLLAVAAFGCQVYSLARVPIAINMILFNTAPFWSALLARFFTNERLDNVQIILMVLSFSGVLVVAFSKPVNQTAVTIDNDGNMMSRYVTGTILAFLVSWCYAGVGVVTRLNQKIHWSLSLFHYSWFNIAVVTVYLLIEWPIRGGQLRLTTYSGTQWGFMILAGII